MAFNKKNTIRKIPIGLRVGKDVHTKLKLIAQSQKRSISNQAEYLIHQALNDYDLPGDLELLSLAKDSWPDTDENIYDVVRKDKRKPL